MGKRKQTEKESLINDLIYANAPAEEVIARHKLVQEQQQTIQEQEKRSLFFGGKKHQEKVEPVVLEAPLYEYQKPIVDVLGPDFMEDEEIQTKGYLAHVRKATGAELAGGYTETITCQR